MEYNNSVVHIVSSIINMVSDVDKRSNKQLMIKMAGYLEKKGRMRVVGVRRWKKRWCVLEGKLLLYFKTQMEYSQHLSPCRGSINIGLVLSITPRGPCQIQIVTRSQIIIFRTKSKSEQDEWLVAFLDAKNCSNQLQNNEIRFGERVSVSDVRNQLSNHLSRISDDTLNSSHLQYGRSLKDSIDDIYSDLRKKNGLHAMAARRTLRKAESDNRISFYNAPRGINVEVTPATGSDKESCRSRSLSYESIYFKPQDHCLAVETTTASKSQSCQELAVVPKVITRPVKKRVDLISKRISRSVSFLRRNDSDSDDYDYIEVDEIEKTSSKAATHVTSSEDTPQITPINEERTLTYIEPFELEELPITQIIVEKTENALQTNSTNFSGSGSWLYEIKTNKSSPDTENEGPPPPLPPKNRLQQNSSFVPVKKYQMADGLHVYSKDNEEIIYDVPIPHGKLIEHFRRLSIASPVQKLHCMYPDVAYDSLEPSLFYETLHMAPDSLEVTSILPPQKRWSGDSGFHYDDSCNTFSPDQTHFEDSLEPVMAMIHHDRKIWQNVPNINSIDYFR